MTKNKNSVPKPNNRDKVYKIVKLGVAGVGTGVSIATGLPLTALGTSLLDIVVKPPIERRFNDFVTKVSERLDEIKYDVSKLSVRQHALLRVVVY